MTFSNQEIADYIQSLERESKALTKYIHKLVWHQRGGMTLNEAFAICYEDREIISELIDERVEIANETHLPYF